MMDNNKENNNNHEKAKRRTIITIIIIIIILSLITSCSCNAKFWGRIGDFFNSHGIFNIDENTGDLPIIKNKDLRFDKDELEMSLDEDGIITFYYKNINPDKFTCVTSDASIATCYVKNDYVVINAKKKGKVTVTLEAITNDKKYQATAEVTIKDGSRYISLGSTKGTINLYYNKIKRVAYNLINLTGKVNVKISDDSVVKASVKDGILTITGLKTGTATITLSVIYNGKEYTATYEVTIVKSIDNNENNKNSDSSLKSLSSSSGTMNFHKNIRKYYLSVPYETDKLTLNAIPTNNKSKVTYEFNGKIVDSLKDLPLQVGENKVKVTVTAEDGTKTVYEITINRSAKTTNKNNTLKNLSVSKGTLSPNFDPDITDYYVSVGSFTNSLDVNVELTDKNSKVKYYFNGKEVDDLKDLPLKEGSNKVEIVVENANGDRRTYTVNIEKSSGSSTPSKSDNNNLKGLTLNNQSVEDFNKNNNDYHLSIPYNEDKFTLKGTAEDNKSKVTYKYNNETYDKAEDIPIKPGETITVEVIVESEDGSKNNYNVDVYRHYRTIEFDNKKHTIDIDINYTLTYTVYEDGHEIDDYDEKEIEFTGFDNITKNHGSLVVKNSTTGTYNLKVSYADSEDTTTLEFIKREPFIESVKDLYLNVSDEENNRSIVLYNNLFPNDITIDWSKKEEGIITICDKEQPSNCIEIDFSEAEGLIIDSVRGSSPLILGFHAATSGNYNIKVKGNYNGSPINEFDITLHIKETYTLTLDANGGYFTELSTTYSFTIEKDDNTFDLSPYFEGYITKASNEEECLYYKLIGFSTSKDGEEPIYDSKNNKITINEDTILYAIYEEENPITKIEETKSLYLTEVNLFHNEEYYNEYGIDKMIYPGASGSYVMDFTNNTGEDITITNLMLEESKTIEVTEGYLPMGYVIKDYNNKYYFGSPGKVNDNSIYKELNHTEENKIDTNISLKNGERTSISLLWRWLDNNDKLDTSIGNYVADNSNGINEYYKLIVRIDFKTTKTECKIESANP